MKDCRDIKSMISPYLDNMLDKAEHSEFENHINSCSDCKKAIEEISCVIETCKSIPAAELPEDFKANLRRKLDAERESIHRRHVLRSKYIKICSSIAAGIVIIITMKGFLGDMVFPSSKMSNSTGTDMKAAASQANPQERFDTSANSVAAYDSSSKSTTGQSAQYASSQADNGVGSDSGKEPAVLPVQKDKQLSTYSQAESLQDKAAISPEKPAVKAAGNETGNTSGSGAGAKNTEPVNTPAQTRGMLLQKAAAAAPIRYNVVLNTDSPSDAFKVLNDIVEKTGGVSVDPAYSSTVDNVKPQQSIAVQGLAVPQAKADVSSAAASADSKGDLLLNIKIPAAAYDRLTGMLKSNFPASDIHVDKVENTSLKSAIDELNRKILDIDNKLASTEASETVSLKAERQSLQSRLDSLNSEAEGFVLVNIVVTKK